MIRTMLQLRQEEIETHLAFVAGDCFIDHARNQIVAQFLETDCTHLIMIDADQGWEVENVLDLLDRPEEVVAGVVIGREGEGKWHITPEMDDNNVLTVTDGM